MPIPVEQLIREAKRIEEDTTYSAKRHFNACAYWNMVHYGIGIPTVVVAALAGTLAAGKHNTSAATLSFAAALLAGLATFLNPHQRANAHAVAGNRYNALKNRARMFYELHCADEKVKPERLEKELAEIASQRDRLNEQSPPTPWLAFVLARRGIEQGETTYAVDAQPPRDR